jgi:molecular chaperone Hsp33
MSSPLQPSVEFTRVESIFVRHRNALLLRADLGPVFTDYYLHLLEQKLRNPPRLDAMLKDLLGCFVLHLVSRPWAETIAWTVNLRAPRANLFVTGSSTDEAVTARIFTEDVREPDQNYFYAQTTAPNLSEPRLSSLIVDDNDPVRWVEQYYTQSEQRPGRAFHIGGDRYALLAAQPGFDQQWFESATAESITAIDQSEETKLLETRQLRFHCGCSISRILPILGSWSEHPEDLFGTEDIITIQCPRCAARYTVSRDMF